MNVPEGKATRLLVNVLLSGGCIAVLIMRFAFVSSPVEFADWKVVMSLMGTTFGHWCMRTKQTRLFLYTMLALVSIFLAYLLDANGYLAGFLPVVAR
jgi:hypothetical protein